MVTCTNANPVSVKESRQIMWVNVVEVKGNDTTLVVQAELNRRW
jgi:hypothetical protein